MSAAEPTNSELIGLRTWRTWLLVVVTAGQALQYAIAPASTLSNPIFDRIAGIGLIGWRVIGLVLLVVALMLAFPDARPFGHALGLFVYLFLVVAVAFHPYWPASNLLFAGIHGGEFYLWSRRRHWG